MDFFGAIGGVSRILLSICGIFFGGYAKFQSAFSINSQLYKVKTNKDIFKKSKKQKDNKQTMNVPVCTRIALFSHLSVIAPLIKCRISKKHKQILQIYKECNMKTKQDLDIVNILDKQRKCIHDIEVMKKKLEISCYDHSIGHGVIEFELTPREPQPEVVVAMPPFLSPLDERQFIFPNQGLNIQTIENESDFSDHK